jgi:hypothetical protein
VNSAVARIGDAARSLGTGVVAGGRGAWRTARRGVVGAALGVRGLASRRPGAGSMLVLGVARLLVQLPVDALLLALVRVASALQTLVAIEPVGRRLDERERGLLRRVFGDGIDDRHLRLKHGRLGVLGLPGAAFAVGDTVHVPARHRRSTWQRTAAAHDLGSLVDCAPALFVHELVHVWQHQRHGTRYLSECLLAQRLGEGYNVAVALDAGRHWDALNFEQQAELLERAFAAGWFDDDADPAAGDSRRLLMRLTDAKRDDGFLVELVSGDDAAATLLAAGWRDATPLLVQGIAAVRGGASASLGPLRRRGR